MGKKFSVFVTSVFVLIALLFLALFASMVFSIKRATSPALLSGDDNIAVLEITGVIMTSSKITEKIAALKNEPSVKAVVVRIDSPGGAVGPSQEIYSELLKLREIMPVYASLGSVAASGGYYIAAACEKIFSNPGTLTGSIGVIMNFVNMKRLYEYIKIDHSVIKSGKFKDAGSGLRNMTEAEKKLLKSLVTDTFNQFKDAVKTSRKLKPKSLETISDGRILTGLQAKNLGLVDSLGTLNDAISEIGKKVGLKDFPNVVYPLRKKEKLVDYLFDRTISSVINQMKSIKPFSLYYLPETLTEVLYENH